ncbi:hypothetical protein HV560_03915 [Mannheimia pernigra]|uniref:Lipoprotein n=1 Tax=Mannheimia pernigra TaxID=111844 RepID=A0ABD7A7R7_9PAST|nr:hypothetical protein [Mannheimia pernigra]QLB42029.1 hypothetical protein HV560_03915 [Mannheimia pernigra]
MKNKILLLSFLLSGCYLANGSPNESNYWVKDNNKISYTDKKKCKDEVHGTFDERFFYLLNKFDNDYLNLRKNVEEYKEFEVYLEKESQLISQCYYALGYRFKAPLYWCMAQDGDNTKTCMENMKYRN